MKNLSPLIVIFNHPYRMAILLAIGAMMGIFDDAANTVAPENSFRNPRRFIDIQI